MLGDHHPDVEQIRVTVHLYERHGGHPALLGFVKFPAEYEPGVVFYSRGSYSGVHGRVERFHGRNTESLFIHFNCNDERSLSEMYCHLTCHSDKFSYGVDNEGTRVALTYVVDWMVARVDDIAYLLYHVLLELSRAR